MTEHDLPAPVRRAIDAVNAGDTDAFLAEFATDGWIDDNGRRFNGYSRFAFEVDGDALRSMKITA